MTRLRAVFLGAVTQYRLIAHACMTHHTIIAVVETNIEGDQQLSIKKLTTSLTPPTIIPPSVCLLR